MNRVDNISRGMDNVRAATANEDVQVNFGVVMNENLGDEVKMTVIATGFEREGIPIPARSNREFVGGPARIYTGIPILNPPPAQPNPPSQPAPLMDAASLPHYEQQATPPVPASAHLDDEIHELFESLPVPSHATHASTGGNGSAMDYHAAPAAAAQAAQKPQQQQQEEAYANDLDIPAFLRRGKRMFQ